MVRSKLNLSFLLLLSDTHLGGNGKRIISTAIQNKYNIGYLEVEAAVNRLNGKKLNSKIISSTVINKGNMYSEENQRLLFPFS